MESLVLLGGRCGGSEMRQSRLRYGRRRIQESRDTEESESRGSVKA